jgi:hypothetical protein
MLKKVILKLYCYVDETGQDTGGKLFIVAIVMTDDQRDKLRKDLQSIERASNKRQHKWTRASRKQRIDYIQAVIGISAFKNLVKYSRYKDSRSYVDLTILSVAKAIHSKVDTVGTPYEATIFIDGMKRSEQHRFGAGVRKLGVKVRKARGLRDQSDEFIRLADAIAGFVRDALENDDDMKNLLKRAVKVGVITEV